VRLQHVSIPITRKDAEQARAFYGGLLGLEERDVLANLEPGRFIWFRLGGDVELHLLLLDTVGPQQGHFCLALAAGLDELRGRLESAGVETEDGTEIIGRPRFTCRDPFGNFVEVAQIPAPVMLP
jgi:catechol 2,3-dioxygenase-like lactoylglutathione lyase family enzyme